MSALNGGLAWHAERAERLLGRRTSIRADVLLTLVQRVLELEVSLRRRVVTIGPHCVYCGQRLNSGYVCARHSDLPALDR